MLTLLDHVRSPYVVACGPQVYFSNLPNRWIGRGIQSLSSQIDGYQAQKLRKWDVQKVQSIFSPEVSQFFLSIPLCNTITQDNLIWKISVDGNYSVKSECHQFCNAFLLLQGSFSYIQGDFWKKLWKIKAIPKLMTLRLY